MFENTSEPIVSRWKFALRLVGAFGVGSALIALSLFAGMWGYHYFEGMTWVDSFANASMILSGMGPLSDMKTDAGKFFAGCYALYSGLALITITAIVFAPIIHRFLHRLHVDFDEEDSKRLDEDR